MTAIYFPVANLGFFFQDKKPSVGPLKSQPQQPVADDVNEDIAAFYKAKDAMLKMRGEQSK
jgi:hypothetical protein